MSTSELSGVTVVGSGSFNPAILHPMWLAEKGLLPHATAEAATDPGATARMVVSPQLTVFVADWLTVQVTPDQAVFSTVDEGREVDLRDLARSVFDLLPETPVDAIGINVDSHFRAESESAWHSFGDRFLPKDFWEPFFGGNTWLARPDGHKVGMRVMTVEVHRSPGSPPGHVRIELAPSVRITPNGIYVGINSHYQLSTQNARSNARAASEVLVDNWDQARSLETELLRSLLEEI